jgi:biopolymer transport protein ExbB/TolQ
MVSETASPYSDFMLSLAQNFQESGNFRWVLLGVLIFALAVAVERLVFYYITCRRVRPTASLEAAQAIENGSVADAISRFEKRKDPLSLLMATTLRSYRANASLEEIGDAVDEDAVMQVPRFSQRLNYLSLFANIATLLGLLGTIAGLQEAFMALDSLEASQRAAMLAGGISKAMNTTAFGLVIAVPCMVAYTFLHNKQKALTQTLDDAMLRLHNFIRRRKH